MDDKGFIIGMALPNKRHCCCIETGFARLNASAVIDNQSEAYRNILMLENGYRLRNAILCDFEIFLRQANDVSLLFIDDGNMQLHEVRVDTQYKWSWGVLT